MAHTCKVCSKRAYSDYCVQHKPLHCILCDEIGHNKNQCSLAPAKKKSRGKNWNTFGKYTDRWKRCRRRWYELNLPDHAGYYYCHYCGIAMTKEESTLDHIKTRSEAPELRYDQDNLVVCCWPDNSKRGSMKYETFIKKYYPHLLHHI